MDQSFKNFNLAQCKIINHWGSNLLVIAGPGTGKTHTFLGRLAALVSRLNPSQKILGLTFTNKAAERMRQRLKKSYPSSQDKCCVETFHSFCLKMLIQNRRFIGLPEDFSIAGSEEISDLIKNQCSPSDLNNIRKYKASSLKMLLPDKLNAYEICLRSKHKIDHDDVLLLCEEFYTNNPIERNAIQQEYPIILVDDYQDITAIQEQLLISWFGSKSHITVFGDPDQAIYGSRGSDVSMLHNFSKKFEPVTTLALGDNLRSASLLINASKQVISQVVKNSKLESFAISPPVYTDGKLVVYEATTEKSEAEFVVKTIEDLVGSNFSGNISRRNKNHEVLGFGDIAVLYRLKELRTSLCSVLDRRGIPFEITGNVRPEAESITAHARQKVHLMSMHASKGLEFLVVFIIGCEENIIPLKIDNFKSDEEEERRLFYVAMTRAKESLYLVRSGRRNLFEKRMFNSPTQFLFEIDGSLKTIVKSDSMVVQSVFDQQLTLSGGSL